MTREQITPEILDIFSREFEIDNPGLDDDLRETYGFDSVDAIELLLEIERFLHSELTHEEKKMAMEIRTIRQIIDYVELMARERDCDENSQDIAGDQTRCGRRRPSAHEGKKSRHHGLFGDHAHRPYARGDRGEPPAGRLRRETAQGGSPPVEVHPLPGLRDGRLSD